MKDKGFPYQLELVCSDRGYKGRDKLAVVTICSGISLGLMGSWIIFVISFFVLSNWWLGSCHHTQKNSLKLPCTYSLFLTSAFSNTSQWTNIKLFKEKAALFTFLLCVCDLAMCFTFIQYSKNPWEQGFLVDKKLLAAVLCAGSKYCLLLAEKDNPGRHHSLIVCVLDST